MENNLRATVAEESAKSGLFLVSGSLVATVVSAIATIIITRLLGPEFYGQYILALVTPQLLFIVTDFGINSGLTRFAANLRTKGEMAQVARIIRYGMLIKALTGIAIFLVNYTLAYFFATVLHNRPELGFYIQIASISILFQVMLSASGSAYVGLDKSEYNALTTNIQATAKAIIAVALVLAGFGVIGAVTGYVVGYVVGGVLSLAILFVILRRFTGDHGDYSIGFSSAFKTLMGYGLPLYISALLAGFLAPYQSLILGLFTSDAEVGYFRAATNFLSLITIVSIPISTALLPAFAKLSGTANERIRNFFFYANKYTVMLVVPIATLVAVFSAEIVQIIYGSEFQTAALYLSLYCLLYFLTGLGYLTQTSLFNGLGQTRITMKISLITFAILIPLSPFLTSIFGVIGVIAATLAASTAGTLYGMHVAKKDFRIQFATRSLVKIYVATALSVILPLLFIEMSPLPKLVNVLTGGVLYLFIYITLSPLLGIVDQAELQTLRRIIQKTKTLGPVFKPLINYQERILKSQERKQPFVAETPAS